MDEIPKQLRTEITGLSRSVVAPFIATIAAELASVSIRPIIQTLIQTLGKLENPVVSAVFSVIDESCFNDQRMEAIDRLAAHKEFSRRALFHPNRWAALAEGYNAYCAEQGLTAEQAWKEIVRPALIFGLTEANRKAMAEDSSVIEFFRFARREVRREIELAILDGRTLDQRREVELPEDENALPDWFDFEPDVGLGEREQELFRQIGALLTSRELQALMDHPTDKASLMARKRAIDKIHKAGNLLLQSAQTK